MAAARTHSLALLLSIAAAALAASAHGAPDGDVRPASLLAPDATAEPGAMAPRIRATPIFLEGVLDPALKADLLGFAATDGSETFEWTMTPLEKKGAGGETVYEVRFPSPRPSGVVENDTVVCRFHPAQGVAPGSKAPAAILLHHLAGADRLETMIAEYLSKSGVAALEIDFPYYGQRRPKDRKDLEKGLLQAEFDKGVAASRQSVADVRRALDWMLARPEVDAERAGIVGVSLGAIQGSIVLGAEPRLKRNVLTLGGGDLVAILTHPSRETRKVREALAERGITNEELARRTASVEPLRYASRVDPRTVLMLNASKDEVIPRASTDALWKALHEPEIHWYPTGHASIAGFLLDLLPKMRKHFLKPVPATAASEVF